jgi:hypothetical protein
MNQRLRGGGRPYRDTESSDGAGRAGPEEQLTTTDGRKG